MCLARHQTTVAPNDHVDPIYPMVPEYPPPSLESEGRDSDSDEIKTYSIPPPDSSAAGPLPSFGTNDVDPIHSSNNSTSEDTSSDSEEMETNASPPHGPYEAGLYPILETNQLEPVYSTANSDLKNLSQNSEELEVYATPPPDTYEHITRNSKYSNMSRTSP